MISVEDIWKDLLVRSGQFILTPTNVKLDQTRLVPLVKDALRYFSKHCPQVKQFNLTLSGPSSGSWTFTDDFVVGGETVGIPYMITDAVPLRLFGTVPLNMHLMSVYSSFRNQFTSPTTAFIDKCPMPVAYREPTLHVPLQGEWDVSAAFVHRIEKLTYSDSERVGEDYWVLPTVSDMNPQFDSFFELLHGLFLQALGKSRRAFTIEDLPVRTDADTMVSEGIRIEEDTKQRISDNDHAWYLAW